MRLHRYCISLTLPVALCSVMVAQTRSSSPATARAGIEGTISVSPVRGGPTREGVSDSAPLANTTFVVKNGHETVASFATDSDGRFRVSLTPGHYLVARKNGNSAVGHCGPFEVDVAPEQTQRVKWRCDTGLR